MSGESLGRSFSKFLAVNARSQEGRISEPLLEIFKTAGRSRSLMAGESLVWSSLCKASSKVRAVMARRQEGQSHASRNENFITNTFFSQLLSYLITLFP